MSLNKISSNKSFGGEQARYSHYSNSLQCDMKFSVYLPECAQKQPVPVLYWLSGLTCTDENFVTKAGAQAYANQHKLAIVAPDTSPRGEGVPDDPNGDYDFGLGAGFYLNATQAPWQQHYQMYDYIVHELSELISNNFSTVNQKKSISGHSMGGHGALTIALKNSTEYCSASAFAPIVAPSQCPWGQKAFRNYLGEDMNAWLNYDTCHLLAGSERQLPLLIDQGTQDDFLQEQLKPELLLQAAQAANYPLEVRMQEGYDHSYFFIASFIEEHIAFHAQYLHA